LNVKNCLVFREWKTSEVNYWSYSFFKKLFGKFIPNEICTWNKECSSIFCINNSGIRIIRLKHQPVIPKSAINNRKLYTCIPSHINYTFCIIVSKDTILNGDTCTYLSILNKGTIYNNVNTIYFDKCYSSYFNIF